MKKVLLLGLTLAMFSTATLAEEKRVDTSRKYDLTVSEAVKLINKGVTIIDIRTKEEIKESGKITGALTGYDYLAGDFPNKVKNLDKDSTYLLYCRSGRRSEEAKQEMQILGFKDVYDLEGGIINWIAKEQFLEK